MKYILFFIIGIVVLTGCTHLEAPPNSYTFVGNVTIDGNLTVNNIYYNDSIYDDLRFPAINLGKAAAHDPESVDFINGIKIYAFDDNTNEELFADAQLPHSWNIGTIIYPHFHFVPLTNNTGSVVWCIEYTWTNINDKFSTTDTICTNKTVSAQQNYHIMTSDIELSGINKTESSMILMRLYRNAAHDDDNLTGDVGLLEFDIHYKVGKAGQYYLP